MRSERQRLSRGKTDHEDQPQGMGEFHDLHLKPKSDNVSKNPFLIFLGFAFHSVGTASESSWYSIY